MKVQEAFDLLQASPPVLDPAWDQARVDAEVRVWIEAELPKILRRARRLHHPDVQGGDEAKFKLIDVAGLTILKRMRMKSLSLERCACGARSPRENFCGTCGRPSSLVEKLAVCPACTTPRLGKAKFCESCGFAYVSQSKGIKLVLNQVFGV